MDTWIKNENTELLVNKFNWTAEGGCPIREYTSPNGRVKLTYYMWRLLSAQVDGIDVYNRECKVYVDHEVGPYDELYYNITDEQCGLLMQIAHLYPPSSLN